MYGIVLEGGGARGAYQIGAYKALAEEGIDVRGVAGTSVGALNGAIIAQGNFEKAYELWHDISYSKVIKANDDEIERLKKGRWRREDIFLVTQLLKGIIEEGGLDISPLKNLLKEVIDENKIRNSGKDFAIVTVSLSDFKPMELYIEDIPYGKLVDYLMASAYLPVFKREKIDGKSYLDGGVYNNLPADLLIKKGYKDLIIIRTGSFGIVKKIDFKGLNTLVISPKEDLGGILDFDKNVVRYNLKLGYFDGLKALKGLKGNKYYIEPKGEKEYFIRYLMNLEERRIENLKVIFRVNKEIPAKRALFEVIIPKLCSLLDLKVDADYDEIFLTLLENLAEIYEVERFRVYTYEKLTSAVREKINCDKEVVEEDKEEIEEIIERVIKKIDMLSIFTKNEVIKEVGKVIFS
ncbi:patatin [Thermoanaerobacter sp. YS13]|uniref:patatin-like phospholipase family protein n=1 Tax=Thermoanaerobacter sp. YS13 TaxID=1511746 RepID=UPI000573D313|nr:patatin-like phospholipase family protein [Thermoanaerobacter sp. YS13]KHO62924.1 patatin [Thermoanaerobacter sp. YS13]